MGHRILTERDSSLAAFLPANMRVDAYAPRVLTLAGSIALLHHEWWNGKGYPEGRVGEDTPLPARIVAVTDALDALRSVRPYKESLSWSCARERILEASGTHFDPAVCEAFIRAESALIEIDTNMRSGEKTFEREIVA